MCRTLRTTPPVTRRTSTSTICMPTLTSSGRPWQFRVMTGADVLLATGEARGATFTYTAPVSGSPQANVPEPTTLDLDADDERRFLGAYGSVEWMPASRLSISSGLRLNATSE